MVICSVLQVQLWFLIVFSPNYSLIFKIFFLSLICVVLYLDLIFNFLIDWGCSLHGYWFCCLSASFLIAFFSFFMVKLQIATYILNAALLVDCIMYFKVIEWMFIEGLLILLCKSQFRSDLICFQSYFWFICF